MEKNDIMVQEIFDKVASHLLWQYEKSQDINMNCKYRTVSFYGINAGMLLKCAVGCLISDEEYQPEFEGLLVGNLITCYPDAFDKYAPYKNLLISLQKIHDQDEVKDWKRQLIGLARDYNLKINF